jgi:hypothetical protein
MNLLQCDKRRQLYFPTIYNLVHFADSLSVVPFFIHTKGAPEN